MGSRIFLIASSGRSVPRTRFTRFVRTRTITGTLGTGTISSNDSTVASGQVSRTISTKRAAARPSASGSVPRSNRADASLRRPSRFAVRAIHMGVQWAISSSRLEVDALTSLLCPPITAAIPTAVSAPSTITPSCVPARASVRWTPSRVVSVSPSCAQRTPIRPPASLSRSNAWLGFPSSSITKFDASTRFEIGRIPARVRRACTHKGESVTRTLRSTATVSRSHRSVAMIEPRTGGFPEGGAFTTPATVGGCVNGRPSFAATSRAMPTTLIASGRLGFTERSNTTSGVMPRAAMIGMPSGVDPGNCKMPP